MSVLPRLRPLTHKIQINRLSTLTPQLPSALARQPHNPFLARSMSSSPLPKTMKGVQISKTGGPEVLNYLTDLPLPTPKDDEVLVKNSVIGINYIDTYFRTGLYPSPLPLILGREAAGIVISSPNPLFSPGDRVVFMGTYSYAEYTCAPASKTLKIPEGITETDACAAILQGLTALTLVEEAHKVEKGDWVLVTASTGGVGGWLLQILRAKGAKTIATVGSEQKVEEARRLGASVVVVEKEGELEKVVGTETRGEGVRAVFDSVGKATFERSLEVVGRKGTVVSYGNASGAVEPFAISQLAAKNVKVTRPTLFNYIYTREEYEKYADELWRLMLQEKFDVRVHKTYPLQDVAQAQSDLESRKTMGKLLMTP